MYYHLSRDSKLTHLTPRIPEYAVPTYEDILTPRICFSDSIEGCLSSLQCERIHYVYTPKRDIKIHIPTVEQIRDAKYTGEVWCFEEKVEVTLLGVIKSEDYVCKQRYETDLGHVYIH